MGGQISAIPLYIYLNLDTASEAIILKKLGRIGNAQSTVVSIWPRHHHESARSLHEHHGVHVNGL